MGGGHWASLRASENLDGSMRVMKRVRGQRRCEVSKTEKGGKGRQSEGKERSKGERGAVRG